MITETLKVPKTKWLKDLGLLKGLAKFANDKQFQAVVKKINKERLAKYIESTVGVWVNPEHMFDVQVSALSTGRCV